MTDIVNYLTLALSILLLMTCALLVRPANGDRPLLVGFMISGAFGLYISIVRVFALQSSTKALFGYVLLFWLLIKLWAIYAAALHTNRPFRLLVRRGLRRLFTVDK